MVLKTELDSSTGTGPVKTGKIGGSTCKKLETRPISVLWPFRFLKPWNLYLIAVKLLFFLFMFYVFHLLLHIVVCPFNCIINGSSTKATASVVAMREKICWSWGLLVRFLSTTVSKVLFQYRTLHWLRQHAY